MKTGQTRITPLEWNEAKQLAALVKSTGNGGQVLVVDPQQGVTRTAPAELISPNENINGSVRFGIHG